MKHVHGGNIYTYRNCMDFSANCNPLGTPESVKQAVRDSLDRTGDYPQVGYAPLREALGEYEDMDPRHIICIGSVLMSQMNNPGKATSIFMIRIHLFLQLLHNRRMSMKHC